MDPMVYPTVFNSWYECSRAAHKESISILQKMGYANVNKYQMATKYNCKIVDET